MASPSSDPLGVVKGVTEKPLLVAQYATLIDEIDKTLALVRGFWMESRDDVERAKNMKRINGILDERIRLMRARDAAEVIEKPAKKGVKL